MSFEEKVEVESENRERISKPTDCLRINGCRLGYRLSFSFIVFLFGDPSSDNSVGKCEPSGAERVGDHFF